MIKKLFTFAVIGAASLGLVASAGAAIYEVNMCGASAQAGFWQAAGEAVVKDALNCDTAELDGLSDDNMIVKGTNCNADGTKDDTVYVRYKAENSKYGCENYDGVNSNDWPAGDHESGDCTWTNDKFDCTVAVAKDCQIGCADVPCDTITAVTVGHADGRSGSDEYGGSDPYTSHGDLDGGGIPTPNVTDNYTGVTVPFGFIVNNAVTDYVCVAPDQDTDLPVGAELAYNKENWECDPRLNQNGTENAQCLPDFKCVDHYTYDSDTGQNTVGSDGIGVCLDGNHSDNDLDKNMDEITDDGLNGTSRACGDVHDCKWKDLSVTSCEARPLKNISRLMVLHIFSDAVDNWQDFGPGFPDLAIVKCMRHGGSGTHQTLINTVFRGDALLKTNSSFSPPADQPNGAGKSWVWHYTSSSDLTRDCVAYYAGGIGYVDADKIMYRSKVDVTYEPADFTPSYGIHQLMYQGVAPSRLAVAQGKYNFWAQQRCFTNDANLTAEEKAILEDIMAGAADESYLNYENFNQRAFFWATEGEMRLEKVNQYAYPTRLLTDPGLPDPDPGHPFSAGDL